MNVGKTQYFGWIPPEERTPEQTAASDMALATLPVFDIVGDYKAGESAKLYEARQKVSGKQDPPYIWQSTGSCVGAGGGNALLTLLDIEQLLGDMQENKMIWWLFPYGESREIAGMRGRGSGSFGAAYAKAITQRGVFAADADPSLPQYQSREGWYYLAQNIELEWSDGGSLPQKWNELGSKNLVKTMARITNADDAAKAIQNAYPLTAASMFGTKGPKVVGDPPVLLAEWDGSWAHQMFVDAWWDHPTLGEIFRQPNNWGPHAHSRDRCPSGAPKGGFWIRKATMERICKSEVFAMSSFEGFPARSLWWDIV
jgi:hypothetical protein